jgi:hypothetical protein
MSRDEAIEWAKRCPAAANEVIEIRTVMDMADPSPDVCEASRDRTSKRPLGGGGKVVRGIWPSNRPRSGWWRGRLQAREAPEGSRSRGGRGAMGIGARRMFGWAVGGGQCDGRGRVGRAGSRLSELPLMGSGLIELELRDGFGIGEVEGRGLIELKFGLGRSPGGGHPGGPMGQVEVEEDVLHGGGEGDERDDPHLATAGGAQEREHFATNASRRCPRATSCAHSMRLDRDRVVGPVGPGSSKRSGGATGWDGRSDEGRRFVSTGISSGSGRPIETTVDLRRALGARTPW